MLKIIDVHPNHIADEIGIVPGDTIVKINGHEINDQIDFQFYFSDVFLNLLIERVNGVQEIWKISREPDEIFGVEFEEVTYHRCNNNCIFCFIHQMPPGLRKELYVKDDDFRLSFLFGNYLSLTNLSDADFERIENQRLSPLFISVHTTDSRLRKKMFRNDRAAQIMDKLKRLADADIMLHIQIVLCPEINNGQYLEKSVEDLYTLYPSVQSIAIVPVGLTRWRRPRKLFPLKKVTRQKAKELIRRIHDYQERYSREIDRNFVYLADEFYLLAEEEIPPIEYYDELSQIEDGVGMVRYFLDEFETAQRCFPDTLDEETTVSFVTSELSQAFMRTIVARLNEIDNLDVRLAVIENRLFGEQVTVTGLLTGKDIIHGLKDKELGDLIVLPPNVLNDDDIFLDDLTIQDIEASLHTKAIVPDYSLRQFYDVVFKRISMN